MLQLYPCEVFVSMKTQFLSLCAFLFLFTFACTSTNDTGLENPTVTPAQSQSDGIVNSNGLQKGTGGVKIDTDIDCDANREDNAPCTSGLVIWLNTSPDKICGSGYSFTVVDNGKNVIASGSPSFNTSCDPNYRWANISSGIGLVRDETYTLILTNNCTGHTVGKDSFRWCGKL